jgi:geranylgeranyl diphosphate synthase type I
MNHEDAKTAKKTQPAFLAPVAPSRRKGCMSLTSKLLAAIEDELRLAVGAGPATLRDYYLMLEYHLGWTDGQTSGKRIRPLLCLLTCASAGGAWAQALPMAAAIELLHNFSLIHDDIQDNSPVRRGRATVWATWGPAQAINAGDAMFTQAHLAPHRMRALGAQAEVVLEALEIFDQTCLHLTQGQYLDMAFEQRESVSVAAYTEMIGGKTAALIAASARIGALIAGAAPERVTAFEQYGHHLGLAFQAHDDLLGIWGDPAVTGKSVASDLEKRKKSLPVVYGLEHSADFARAYALPSAQGSPVTELAAQLETLGARAYTQQQATALTAEATRFLDLAAPSGEAGQALRELTEQLLSRPA